MHIQFDVLVYGLPDDDPHKLVISWLDELIERGDIDYYSTETKNNPWCLARDTETFWARLDDLQDTQKERVVALLQEVERGFATTYSGQTRTAFLHCLASSYDARIFKETYALQAALTLLHGTFSWETAFWFPEGGTSCVPSRKEIEIYLAQHRDETAFLVTVDAHI